MDKCGISHTVTCKTVRLHAYVQIAGGVVRTGNFQVENENFRGLVMQCIM